MQPIAVGGFQQQIVRFKYRLRNHLAVGAIFLRGTRTSQVSTEQDLLAFIAKFEESRAEDVSRMQEAATRIETVDRNNLIEGPRRQQIEALDRLLVGVERLSDLMLAESLLVGEGRFFFLEVSGIRKHDARQIRGRRRTYYRAAKALGINARQKPDVIEMRVSQHHPLDVLARDGQRLPIPFAPFLGSL